MAALVDDAHAVFEHGHDEAHAVAEVVLRGGVVALAGGGAHVAQRHRLQAALGEQLLGGLDQPHPGRLAACLGHQNNLRQLT